MKTKPFVRQSLFFTALVFGLNLVPASLSLPPFAQAEILPTIEAHQFKLTPVEKSRSGRVYRFRVDAQEMPRVGNIVLVQDRSKPLMAFRVLKTDLDSTSFVGKRVRRYDTVGELRLNEKYVCVEKVADQVAPPPPEPVAVTNEPRPAPAPATPAENSAPVTAPLVEATPIPQALPTAPVDPLDANGSNLNQLPPEPAATPNLEAAATPMPTEGTAKLPDVDSYDDDLDSSTSPQNLKRGGSMDSDYNEDDEDTQERSDLEVDEVTKLNPFKNMIGVSIGSLRNSSNFAGNTTNNSFTAYYSNELDHRIFAHGRRPQDSLSLEYAFSYYSLLNANQHNDDYTLLPLRGELRYDLHLSESFSLLTYAGIQYNLVLSTQNVSSSSASDQAVMHKLQGFQPTFGAGFLYNVGPQWYLRGDLGVDRIVFGLAVKW